MIAQHRLLHLLKRSSNLLKRTTPPRIEINDIAIATQLQF